MQNIFHILQRMPAARCNIAAALCPTLPHTPIKGAIPTSRPMNKTSTLLLLPIPDHISPTLLIHPIFVFTKCLKPTYKSLGQSASEDLLLSRFFCRAQSSLPLNGCTTAPFVSCCLCPLGGCFYIASTTRALSMQLIHLPTSPTSFFPLSILVSYLPRYSLLGTKCLRN